MVVIRNAQVRFVRRSTPHFLSTSLTDTIARPTHWTEDCYANPRPIPSSPDQECFLPAFDPALAVYDNMTEPQIQLGSRVIAKTNHDRLGVTGEMSGYISVRILHTSPYSTRQPARCTVAALNLRRYACQRTDGSLSLTSLSLIILDICAVGRHQRDERGRVLRR